MPSALRNWGFKRAWMKFWMRRSGLGPGGRLATRLATWFAPPYRARVMLARLSPRGYVDPGVTIHHDDVRLGRHVFIGKDVTIFQTTGGGPVELDDHAHIYGHVILETGRGGSIHLGPGSRIHPGSHLISYQAPIRIGRDVGISQNCAIYSYDHGMQPDRPISQQPLQSKGPVVIDDSSWIGTGVIILSGVHIGTGAVVASGSVVIENVPAGAIVVGVPARVVKMRSQLAPNSDAAAVSEAVGSREHTP
jgi:acetyltransferase-like isoleucine patch superfamily enzyme